MTTGDLIFTAVVGTGYRGGLASIERLSRLPDGAWLTVVPEPDNPEDPGALAVWVDDEDGPVHLGYIATRDRDEVTLQFVLEDRSIVDSLDAFVVERAGVNRTSVVTPPVIAIPRSERTDDPSRLTPHEKELRKRGLRR